jgi:hypothetical protein
LLSSIKQINRQIIVRPSNSNSNNTYYSDNFSNKNNKDLNALISNIIIVNTRNCTDNKEESTFIRGNLYLEMEVQNLNIKDKIKDILERPLTFTL